MAEIVKQMAGKVQWINSPKSKLVTTGTRSGGLLAKLKTFSLLGIQAMPVEVEVDVSPRAMPKTILVGLPGSRRPRKHSSLRTRDDQFRFSAAGRSSRHQPGPGRVAQASRLVRSAYLAGNFDRQRADSNPISCGSTRSSASWRWKVTRVRPKACCRWRSRRKNWGFAESSCRKKTRSKRPSSKTST